VWSLDSHGYSMGWSRNGLELDKHYRSDWASGLSWSTMASDTDSMGPNGM
jgi:hypothetical protein